MIIITILRRAIHNQVISSTMNIMTILYTPHAFCILNSIRGHTHTYDAMGILLAQMLCLKLKSSKDILTQ